LFGGAEAVSASAELARYVAREASASKLDLEQAETETALDAAVQPPNGAATPATPADQPLRVSIRARGDIEQIVAFLRKLEEGDRLVRLERIAISAPDENPEDGSLLLTATVSGLARLGLTRDTTATPGARPASRNRFVSRSEP
jgi:hypothetical protein